MHHPSVFLTFLLLFSLNSCRAQSFSEHLDALMDEHGVMGMSAVVVCDGEIEAEYYGGLRNYENEWPVNSDTRYRIASVSKSVTALGCMRLIENGVLELDADVSNYLPFGVINMNHPYVPITLRMLLSHTSSIQDGDGYNGFLTATYTSEGNLPSLGELLEVGGGYYTSNMYRTEEPGTYFAYSNLNFGLVATVMEAITGQRFDVLMDSLVFEPLELGCRYEPSALDDIGNVAALYRNQGGWVAQADQFNGNTPLPPALNDYIPGSNGVRFAPQGGLRASARELHALMTVFLNDGVGSNGVSVLNPGTIEAMLAPEWTFNGSNGNNYYNLFNSWGLGIQQITNAAMGDIVFEGQTMWGHPGEAYGLVSDWYFDPVLRNGVIFLTNGVWNGYSFGENSAFYTLEEGVFAAAFEVTAACASSLPSAPALTQQTAPNFGRPGDALSSGFACVWVDAMGKSVAETRAGDSVPALPPGMYLLRSADGGNLGRFQVQ
jgi:CubicO group peptidase (beta-lactamase class C family)